MAPILAYWNIRGRANPIRMILHYADVRYEDKRYCITDPAHFEQWGKDKTALKGTIEIEPNLPYYIDGMVQISQSRAIIEYLGRKHGLNGRNEQELVKMSLVMEHMNDIKLEFGNIAYPSPHISNKAELHEILRKEFAKNLQSKLASLSASLGTNKWMAGDKLTYVDFVVADILDALRLLFDPKHVNAFPNLTQFMERFENLKGVKEYLQDPTKFNRLPIFAPFAMFGNTVDYKPTE